MDLVCSPTVCPNLQLPAFLDFATRAGFSRVELFRAYTESTPVHPDLSVRTARQHFDATGIQLATFNIRNLTGRKADSDERNLQYNLRQLEWDIHLGRALQVHTFNLKGGDRTDEALEDLVEGVNELLERIPNVTLNLGNHQGNRLENLSDFQTIMPQLGERAKILLDTGHLLTTGQDILQFATTLAARIGLVHLRDQQGEKPVPFGKGELPLEDLLDVLKQADYNGCLVIELEGVDWADPLDATVATRQYIEHLL
jgi:sugar phosphate isomerase/epimerase